MIEPHAPEFGLALLAIAAAITFVGWAVWAILDHITGRAQHDFMQRRYRQRIDRLREGWGG